MSSAKTGLGQGGRRRRRRAPTRSSRKGGASRSVESSNKKFISLHKSVRLDQQTDDLHTARVASIGSNVGSSSVALQGRLEWNRMRTPGVRKLAKPGYWRGSAGTGGSSSRVSN